MTKLKKTFNGKQNWKVWIEEPLRKFRKVLLKKPCVYYDLAMAAYELQSAIDLLMEVADSEKEVTCQGEKVLELQNLYR